MINDLKDLIAYLYTPEDGLTDEQLRFVKAVQWAVGELEGK